MDREACAARPRDGRRHAVRPRPAIGRWSARASRSARRRGRRGRRRRGRAARGPRAPRRARHRRCRPSSRPCGWRRGRTTARAAARPARRGARHAGAAEAHRWLSDARMPAPANHPRSISTPALRSLGHPPGLSVARDDEGAVQSAGARAEGLDALEAEPVRAAHDARRLALARRRIGAPTPSQRRPRRPRRGGRCAAAHRPAGRSARARCRWPSTIRPTEPSACATARTSSHSRRSARAGRARPPGERGAWHRSGRRARGRGRPRRPATSASARLQGRLRGGAHVATDSPRSSA